MKTLSLIFIAFVLAGCAGVPIPQKEPFEAGVFNVSPQKSRANKVPSGENVSLGVVLNKNTIENIEYLQKRYEKSNDGNPILDRRLVEANRLTRDPDFVIRWVMKSLSDRFGSVKVYANKAAFEMDQPDILAVLDMQFYLVDWGNLDTNGARNVVRFYDGRQQFIAEAIGEKTRPFRVSMTPGIPQMVEMINDQKRVLTESLVELDKSIDGVISTPLRSPKKASEKYDDCIRATMNVSDVGLRIKAMNTCNSVR